MENESGLKFSEMKNPIYRALENQLCLSLNGLC